MSVVFNPFTGRFDFKGDSTTPTPAAPENFSHKKIDTGYSKTIPENQQMLVDGHVTVIGHLSVQGELIDISARQNENTFYTIIEDVVMVNVNRLLLYKNHLTIRGHVRVLGHLTEC